MSKHPKTIAEVQKRERSQWAIGDALLDETDIGGSHDELAEVASEIEDLQIEGYSVAYLAKLRQVASNFPPRTRTSSISWEAHKRAGSPEMLEAIAQAAGKKPVTVDFVAPTRKAIEEHQAKKHQEKGTRRTVPPVKDIPSQREVKGLALIAEIAQHVNNLKRYDLGIVDEAEWVEKNLSKLEKVDIDYLVEIALGIAEHARGLADIARRLRTNRRTHLSVVGE